MNAFGFFISFMLSRPAASRTSQCKLFYAISARGFVFPESISGKAKPRVCRLLFLCLAFVISFFAITGKTEKLQDRLYGEEFGVMAKWLVVAGGLCLYYMALSYVSALDFNPFFQNAGR